jgi:hypothetical protein
LAATFSRQLTETYFRLWLDAAWVLLTLSLLFCVMSDKKTLRYFDWRATLSVTALLIFLLIRSAFAQTFGVPLEFSVIPLDLKFLLYVLLSGLIVGAVGAPSKLDWGRAGVMLAVIILFDTAVESISAGSLTRPQGSGEVNYDAMLLTIALGFLILQPTKIHKKTLWSVIIVLAALVATQSRTMFLSATLLLFFLTNLNLLMRLTMLVVGIGGVFAMFMMRDLVISFEAVDRYWMWVSGLNLLMEPSIFFFGSHPGQYLYVEAPEALQSLWAQQTENYTSQGVFTFNFHAFWLRFAINFGVPITLVILAATAITLVRSPNQVRRYLAGLFILSGFTMGSLYLSNVGVPILLALATTLRESEGRGDV